MFKKPASKIKSSQWDLYFSNKEHVSIGSDRFQIYTCTNPNLPANQLETTPVLVLLHGMGTTSMSWASCVEHLKKSIKVICAMDLRGHGGTETSDDTDLSIKTMTDDVCKVLAAKYGGDEYRFIFCGHSVGGSVAVHAVNKMGPKKASGVIVFDMCEGTAKQSIRNLKSVLNNRPKSFKSLSKAVEWNYNLTKIGLEKIKISTPSQLVYNSNKEEYYWKTDLTKSEKHWKSWFDGLSKLFIDGIGKIPKILVVAHISRLDTPLTIAHMQGKFMFKILYGSNHFLHESKPKESVEIILSFCKNFVLL